MKKEFTEEQLQIFKKLEKLEQEVGSQNKAGLLTGVSGSIIGQIKKGIYKGDVDTQFEKLRDYFATKEESQTVYSATKYVPTSISSQVYDFIRNAQIKGGLVAISGDAGIGKTRAIRKFHEDHPYDSIWVTGGTCVNSVKTVLTELCLRLGVNTGANYKMYKGILEKLRDGMVIIIDEAQHISLKTIEALRGFSDYFSDNGQTLGIVFCGNIETINKFGGKQEAIFHQIANRTKQKPVFRTRDIVKDDIKLLFPEVSTREPELKFLLGIAQSSQAIRGVMNLYANAHDNDNVTYEGIVAMAKHMNMRI